MKKLLPIALFFIAFLVSSCSTQQVLYNWGSYDDAVYNYIKAGDQASKEALIAVYDNLINNPSGGRKVVPPGVYADYGYLLIKSGENKKGKEFLEMEINLYPESKPFIERILKRFE
jgi:hypothetical protein